MTAGGETGMPLAPIESGISEDLTAPSVEPALYSAIVDGLLRDFADVETTVKIEFPNKRLAEFRVMSDEVRMSEIEAEGREWVALQIKLFEERKLVGRWAEFGTDHAPTLTRVFILAKLSMTEGLDELGLLIVARRSSALFRLIWKRVLSAAISEPKSEEEIFDEEKKD